MKNIIKYIALTILFIFFFECYSIGQNIKVVTKAFFGQEGDNKGIYKSGATGGLFFDVLKPIKSSGSVKNTWSGSDDGSGESYADEDSGDSDDMGWTGDDLDEGDDTGGYEDPRSPGSNTANYTEDGGSTGNGNQLQIGNSTTGPCVANKFLVFGNGIIAFTPAQMQKITKFLFDGNNLTGFIDINGNTFSYVYKVKTLDDGSGRPPIISKFQTSYDFVCFDYLDNNYAALNAQYTNPQFERYKAYNPDEKKDVWVFKNIPNDEHFRYSFDSKAQQCSPGDQINAIVSGQASTVATRENIYCYTLKQEDCNQGGGLKRDEDFIPPSIQLHLDTHINVPDWLRKFMAALVSKAWSNCSINYVNAKLDKLHQQSNYINEPSSSNRAEMEFEAFGYAYIYGVLKCATDEEAAKGQSSTIQYNIGELNEIINTLDIDAMIDGISTVAQNRLNVMKQNMQNMTNAIREMCENQTKTGKLDYKTMCTKILESNLTLAAKDYQQLSNIASHFQIMYFRECDRYKFNDQSFGDICSYRHGQIAIMALPVLLTAGDYTLIKAESLFSKYLVRSKEAVTILKDAELAGKIVVDEYDAALQAEKNVIRNPATNEIETTIKKEIDDVNSFEEFVVTKASTYADRSNLSSLTGEIPSPSGNLSKGKFNNSAYKFDPSVDPTLKSIADDIILNGDAGGGKSEILANTYFREKLSYTDLTDDVKLLSDKGFDGLQIDGTIANPNEIIILEAKQQWDAGVKLSVNSGPIVQGSKAWYRDVSNRMKLEAQNYITSNPVKAQKMIDASDMLLNPANASKIKVYVVTLNRPVGGAVGTGSVNILKLNPF